MADIENTVNDELKKLDLSSLPDKANVHIHMPKDEAVVMGRAKEPTPRRTLIGMITGAIGAAVGYVTSRIYVNQKMFDFDTEVLSQTKENILGRSGLGASIAESGAGSSSLAGIAGGFSSGEIHMSNATKLAQSEKYGKFPKFIYKTLGGPQGKSMVALAGAAAVGTVAAGAGYLMAGPDAPKAESDKDKNWSNRVEGDKEQTRSLS